MKTNTSIYGVMALISIVASSVLSYAWSVLGNAAYGAAALVLGGAFVWAIATVANRVERSERGTVTKVDFTPEGMNRAA